MNPVSPWIAALADQCLSFYIGQNDQDEVQVEDIDGCLSFSFCKPTLKTAVVVSWGEGEKSHCATFTDSKNQIDAIILHDSPDVQGATSPCPPSLKGGPRHLVELFDIKLILTYSAPAPDVCLQIKRFTIHPNAVPRGDVPKPKLKKTTALRALMTMACDKIQKTRGHAGSNDQTNARLTDPFASQRDRTMPPNHSQTNMASQLLFSQPPSNMRHGAPKSNAMTSRVSLNGSSDLLGLLAPSHPIQTNYAAAREVLEAHRLPLGESESRHSPLPNTRKSVAPEIGRPLTEIEPSFRRLDNNTANSTRSSEYVTNQSYADIEKEVVDFIAECTGTQPPNDHGPARNVGMGDIQLSKKRHCGSADVPTHNDDLGSQGRQSSNTQPSKKRQRIDAGEVIPPNKSERVQNKLMQSPPRVQIVNTKTDIGCPSATSPWDGMMKIPLSEVHIPKDQAELLEGLKWIPQDPGVSTPLCHVPPRLLTQWNNIARRRQHLAEEAEAEERLSERALTSTPQEPSTSPIPWSPSPDRAPARDVLPRDTASPPRYIRPTRGASPPTGTQYSVDQSTKNGDVDMVNGSCSAPQPGPGDVVSSRNDTRTAEQQCSPSPEEVTTKPRSPLSLDHDPDLPQEHNASKSVDVVNDQPPSITQEHSHDQSPAKNIPLRSGIRDESSGDESDEPEMETYVPFALGGSLPLSSQPEQEPTSSGPSLPRFAGGTIQVVETPAANTTRLNPGKQSEQRTGVQPPSSQQPYSEATKTSPSSRIPNTYRSQDNHGHSDLSQDEPPLMDVLGTQTQTSSVHALSQATVQSSPDVVLDSSRPVQRQRGSSIFHLDPSDNPSSFPYVGSHSLPTSQLHEISQHSPGGLDGGSQLPELSPMEFTTSVAAHGESPSKRPKSSRPPRCEGVDTGQKAAHGPNVELVARRQGSIGNSDEYAEAQTVYEKFCNDYSPYAGGFAHFTEMCSKLQAVRQKGQLQRSFLWDDFVIQYLEEYSRYLTEHISEHSKTLDYEDFFCSRFSRPHHKKRSLTAHGIDIVASQFVPPTSTELRNSPVPNEVTIQGEVTQDKAIQSEVANNSFTASLVGIFSNLHAQSFGDAPVSDVCMPTATQSSSSSYPSTGSDSVIVKIEADDSFNGQIGSQKITSSDDQKPVFFNHDEETTDATRSDAESVRFAPEPNDVDMAEADMDEIEETQEGDGTHHETASIELGDDTDDRRISVSPAPPAPPAALGALNNSEPKQPRRRRPWFRSLRNIWPKGPVWSDDPDTPFKRWARQDQNVLQELNRRGGVRVLTDEKGVIRYPTYNRDQDKNPGP